MGILFGRRLLLLAATCPLFLFILSCSGDDFQLLVELKTDLVAGRQFVGVRTEVGPMGLPGTPDFSADRVATTGESFLGGQRIAEFDGVPKGTHEVRVRLLDATGAVVAERTTIMTMSGTYALTVLVTGSCRDVVCPNAGEDAALTACVGGRCVDPRCSPETPEFCGALGCADDTECPDSVSCGSGSCVDSECFVVLDDASCAPNEVCVPVDGCVPSLDTSDAGPDCPASETSCTDGLDDDCDGDIDCADADCAGVSCDDGSVCTTDDACQSDGTCGGTAIDCDDGNDCTDDSCDPVEGCHSTNNTADCDDGSWCNGTDSCADGTCSAHASPPCPSFCNESTMLCEACGSDTDCGSVTTGMWGPCGGYEGTCGEMGTQSQMVMTPRCVSGTCTVETTSESQACMRDTDGTTCGTTTYEMWAPCGGWADDCDETGTQSRNVNAQTCVAGTCTTQTTMESRDCSRSVPNGTSCGGRWNRCCSGVCRDLTANGHCGACNVSCNAIGLTCRSTGTGGYACRGCSTNSMCQMEYGSRATCYDTSAPPAFCQCQCASNGVCSGGGCGGNFYCHDCPGHNFCAPFGGSC